MVHYYTTACMCVCAFKLCQALSRAPCSHGKKWMCRFSNHTQQFGMCNVYIVYTVHSLTPPFLIYTFAFISLSTIHNNIHTHTAKNAVIAIRIFVHVDSFVLKVKPKKSVDRIPFIYYIFILYSYSRAHNRECAIEYYSFRVEQSAANTIYLMTW